LWLAAQSRWQELPGIGAAYRRAQGQNPTLVLRAASLLAAAPGTGLQQEALTLFEQAAALAPASVEARLGLASTLYQTGAADRAKTIYQELLAQHPDNVRALNDLAWILQEADQRYEAALELANRGVKLAPDNLNLRDTRGTILAQLPDRRADARNDFARLADPSLPDTREKARARLWLGRLCVQLQEFPPARQYLQGALEIDRQLTVLTPDERAEIARLLQQAGQ
jgi:tetratricopeptide (TPR) repeat protein